MTSIVADPIYTKHLTGDSHPESPLRYTAVARALEKEGLFFQNNCLIPRIASKEDILLCHREEYISVVERDVSLLERLGITDGTYPLSTGDVQISPESFSVALWAVGGVLNAVDAVLEKKAKNVFCAVRPPGHHACSYKGMGFCLFNNVAIGARYAQVKYGIKKVLIIDWDVHHGNGTQEIFEEDPTVFYFSTHRDHFYPLGTGLAEQRGLGIGEGSTMNIPIELSPSSKAELIEAFQNNLTEAMKMFHPDLVMISAGFDAHRNDPIGGLNLVEEDFVVLTKIALTIAENYAGGKLISVLEGGYDLESLSSSVVAHVRTLKEGEKVDF